MSVMQFNDGIFIVARQTGGATKSTSLEPPLISVNLISCASLFDGKFDSGRIL